VLAADTNPRAVAATRVNAMLNRVSIAAVESDLFEHIEESSFRIIAFNPPFFGAPQGGELAMALSDGPSLDTLDRFCGEARDHLTEGGLILVAGSTSGALALMRRIYAQHGFRWRTVATRERISERLVIDRLE
jgi:methylase of polypeptide subunit release factors